MEYKCNKALQYPQLAEIDLLSDEYCCVEPPFWYPKSAVPKPRPSLPVGKSEDLGVWNLLPPDDDKDWLMEMNLERSERYIPGEVYKNASVKQPIQDLTKTTICQRRWMPRDQNFNTKFDPCSFPPIKYILYENVLKRQSMTLAQTLKESIAPPASMEQFDLTLAQFPPDRKSKKVKFPSQSNIPDNRVCPCGCGVKHSERGRFDKNTCAAAENRIDIFTPGTNPFCFRNIYDRK